MKKIILAVFVLLVFQAYAMSHRVSMRKSFERDRTQLRDYKVREQQYIQESCLPAQEEKSCDTLVSVALVRHDVEVCHCVPISGHWRKTMGMAMLCTLLVTAQAGCFQHGNASLWCFHVTDGDLIGVAASNPGLVAIELNTDENCVSIDGLQILAKSCPHLRAIYLSRSPLLDSISSCDRDISAQHLEKFQQKYPHIQVYHKSPHQIEQDRKYAEWEERVALEKAERKAAEEKARLEHEKRMKDILGDDRIL